MHTGRASVVVVLLLAGCALPALRGGTGHRQGVRGVVWFKPGYDAGDVGSPRLPADTSRRPLPGAMMYLLKDSHIGPNSRAIIAVVATDSTGRYELPARPGAYHLAVLAPHVACAVLAYSPGAAVGLNFPVNTLVEIEIRRGGFVERSFQIGELVPQ